MVELAGHRDSPIPARKATSKGANARHLQLDKAKTRGL